MTEPITITGTNALDSVIESHPKYADLRSRLVATERERDEAVRESNRRDEKWKAGIVECCGMPINFDALEPKPGIPTLDQFVRSLGSALAAANAEIGRLEAIVGRLPKTADGVPVTPGSTVWYRRNGTREPERIVIRGYEGSGSFFSPDNPGTVFFEPSGFIAIWHWDNCYSTQAAALAARAAEGRTE